MIKKPEVFPANGYECFIHVYNKTNVNFSLWDQKAGPGAWAKGSPPPTITAHAEGLIQLNDERDISVYPSILTIFYELGMGSMRVSGASGSKGEVVFRIVSPQRPRQVSSYQRFNIYKRAPGFYPHIGHISYAIGHTLRRLRNL